MLQASQLLFSQARAFALAWLLLASSAPVSASSIIAWQFERGNVKGVVVATMHAIPVENRQQRATALHFRQDLRKLTANATHIYFERPPFDRVRPDRQRKKPLPANTWDAISRRLSAMPAAARSALANKPDWEIAMALGEVRLARIRMKSQLGSTESEILKLTSDVTRTYDGLEQASTLFAVFNDLSGAAQAEMLRDALADDDQYEAELQELAGSYLSGDHAALCRKIAAGGRQAEYWKSVVAGRNRRWIETLDRFESPGSYLLAVGVAHTCGPGSLQELMVAAGFRLTRLE